MASRLRRTLGLALLAALAAACGRVRPLGGGAPDVVPPQLVASTPPDSSTGIPRRPELRLEFSEKVSPSAARSGLRFYPPLRPDQVDVHGRVVVATFAESLPPDTTFAVVLGRSIQDLPGRDNRLPAEIWLLFSTGSEIRSAGVLGRVAVKGRPETKGAVVYEPLRPDTVAAAGSGPRPRTVYPAAAADDDGLYRLLAIPPHLPFLLRAFVDRNQNLRPDEDELAAAYPETLILGRGEVRRGIEWNLIDPHEPAKVHGVALDLTPVAGPVAVAVWLGGAAATDTSGAPAGAGLDTLGARVRADTLRPLPLPLPPRESSPWAAAYAALEPNGFVRSDWQVVYASPRGDYSVRVPPGERRMAAFVDVSGDSVPGPYVLPDSTGLEWEPLWVGGLLHVGPGEDLRPRTIEIEAPH